MRDPRAIASLVGRRIDAIRLTHERYARELREQEIGKLATEAELRALRAQINPHFLFNALTTIGYLIQTAPPRALDTLMRLTALLRGVLRSEGEFTTLGRELELVESYLDIERARFEQRLRVRDRRAGGAAEPARAAAACSSRIVENAVKHGIAPLTRRRRRDGHGAARRRHGDARARRSSSTTPAPASARRDLQAGRASGVGLQQRRAAARVPVRRRGLAVDSTSAPDDGTTVEIRLPAEYRAAVPFASDAERVMNARLRVVIADDERPARSFLAALLRSFDDVVVVAEAASGTEAVAVIEQRAARSGAARPADAGARRHRRRAHAEEAAACR